jgi:hypothetical protein
MILLDFTTSPSASRFLTNFSAQNHSNFPEQLHLHRSVVEFLRATESEHEHMKTRSPVSAGSASNKKTVQGWKRQTDIMSVNDYLQRLFKTCYNILKINFPKIHQLTWTLHPCELLPQKF